MANKIKFGKNLVEKNLKTENLGKKELAATPYHRINRFLNKSNKTQQNSSFRRFVKKSLWNHLKKSETFTSRCALKNQYRRRV